jgi:hypothetical protein
LECQRRVAALQTSIAAMQTNLLLLGIWYTKIPLIKERSCSATTEKAEFMSKTASIGLLPSSTLFGRLMASIDRLLTASSRIAVRNGDLPYFGL